jgi:C1A family cysteine protease
MIANLDMRLKVICCLIIVAAIGLIPSGEALDLQAREHDAFRVASLNRDFIEPGQGPAEPCYGYVAPPVDLSRLDAISVEGVLKAGALPNSFDWRSQGKVTPVKSQGPCGTCWIFGTTSVLESAVLIGDNTAYSFSEQSVALCVDRSWVYLYDDPDEPCGISHGGGWSWLAAEVFIKKGAVLESCDPYDSSGLQCDGACLCDNCTPAKVVDGYRLVTNDQSQTNLIKEALYNQGPVTMAYYHNGAHLYTDATYGAVYDCAPSPAANHMVSVIGWDDNVPHFETPGTGAWLVKNSWGTGFGNSGYLWLAYNSSDIQEIAYLEYEDYDPNEELYYWDEAGFVDDGGYGDPSAWMASIFTSTQDGSLTHVDFWTTGNNAQYDIYVYLDGDISNGLQNEVAFQTGACQELGYYSIPLTSPVSLASGQPFTIAVSMTTPGYDNPLPVEEAIGGVVDPEIQDGVSYTRHGDTDVWEDLATYGCNACLRAGVTSGASGQPDITVGPPSFEVTLPPDVVWNATVTIGNVGDGILTYDVSDRETAGEAGTGVAESTASEPGSPLNSAARVVLSPTTGSYGLPGDCPWLDEDPKSGTVEPGGSDDITVNINTVGLVPGDYSAEVVIDNNDPDQDPTTVPITLHVGRVAVDIVPAEYTAMGNESFSVEIRLSGTVPVRGASAFIDFDQTKLEVQSITPGGSLDTVLENTYDNVAGTIDYSAGKLSGTLPTGTFTLATIEFKALAETGSSTPLTFVYVGPNRVTDVITTGSVSVLGTVTGGEITIITPMVNGQVAFEGRPAASDASWVNSLTVVVLEQGTSTVVDTYAVTTNSTGGFSFVFDHALGTYDIGVKGSHTLSRLEEDVVIDSATTNVNFGTLLEGDCDNNDVVNINDFGILADAYGSVPASGNWDERADLNNDGVVNINDFGLLADDYGLSGETV